MAEIARYLAEASLIDGVNRTSVVQYYVSSADGKAYVAAADTAARAATKVGLLLIALFAMSEMVPTQWGVKSEFAQDSPGPLSDQILRGNKLSFALRSAGRVLTTTIPGRNPASYVQAADSLNLVLDDPAEMADFVAQVNDTVKDQFGNDVVLERGKVVD